MEEKDASNAIESILSQVLTERNGWEEGDVLIDWALVAYVTNADPETKSAYPMLFANGEIPTYRARGLFHTALIYLDPRFENE